MGEKQLKYTSPCTATFGVSKLGNKSLPVEGIRWKIFSLINVILSLKKLRKWLLLSDKGIHVMFQLSVKYFIFSLMFHVLSSCFILWTLTPVSVSGSCLPCPLLVCVHLIPDCVSTPVPNHSLSTLHIFPFVSCLVASSLKFLLTFQHSFHSHSHSRLVFWTLLVFWPCLLPHVFGYLCLDWLTTHVPTVAWNKPVFAVKPSWVVQLSPSISEPHSLTIQGSIELWLFVSLATVLKRNLGLFLLTSINVE